MIDTASCVDLLASKAAEVNGRAVFPEHRVWTSYERKKHGIRASIRRADNLAVVVEREGESDRVAVERMNFVNVTLWPPYHRFIIENLWRWDSADARSQGTPCKSVCSVESAVVSSDRVFLLSPAKAGGPRYEMLLRPQADFDLAVKLRQGTATIGEVYSFISGLYFRGKMAYAEAFRAAPQGIPPALVIVPGAGLVPPDTPVAVEQLRAIADIPVDERNETYRDAVLRTARLLDQYAGPTCLYVLLGSIASGKYTGPLLEIFGERLVFPVDFVGRGDMSRGGLMLRRAHSGIELSYGAVQGAVRHGVRPPRLERWRKP